MTPDEKDKITDQILEAFDEMAEEGAAEGGIEPEPESAPEQEPGEQEPEAEPGEGEPEEQEQVEEVEVRADADHDDQPADEPEGEQEPPEEHEDEYAPEVQAFLDRHGGDLRVALSSAVELQKMLGRRNLEQGEMTRRLAELEGQLAQYQAFEGLSGLNPEQLEWIEQAVGSEAPAAYVQSAVNAGEFELARAVCDSWGQEGDAYSALRMRQMVDEAEVRVQQTQLISNPPEFSREELYGMIQEQVPDFGNFWGEMTEVVNQLGREHPMVAAANSNDPNEAALALLDIYQVARTRSARISEARQEVEKQNSDAALANKRKATVSSASSRSSTEEPPRQVQIGPGLTLDELDAAFAAE